MTDVTLTNKDKTQQIDLDSNDIGKLVNSIILSTKRQGKSTIKIQIEITNE